MLNPGWQILDDLRITAAGTAAGPAVDLAKLGAQPISMGVIGDDYEGGLMVDLMAGFGCDMSRLVRDPGAPTHISLLFIGPTGERNPIMIRPTGARALTLDDIDFDVVAEADVLHVGGADQLGDFIGEPLVELVRHAREQRHDRHRRRAGGSRRGVPRPAGAGAAPRPTSSSPTRASWPG